MINQSTPIIKQFVALVKMKPFDDSLEFIEEVAENIIFDLDLKIVKKISHLFNPIGITLGYILSQSHLIIHTYPEDGIVHVDLAICSDRSAKEFESSLKHAFSKHKVYSVEIKMIDLDKLSVLS